jgi:sugar lactone lactonase YvrE
MKKARDLRITGVFPPSGVPGGRLIVRCRNFEPGLESKILLGDVEAFILSASEDCVLIRLPESPYSLGLTIRANGETSPLFPFNLAVRLAAELHPVMNPVIAPDGSIITTISGGRGQEVDFPLVRVTRQGDKIPYSCEIMNPTGLAFSPDGQLYISSRHDGTVLRYTDFDHLDIVAEDLGIPCGMVFDSSGYLYVGDRTGRIWKIDKAGRKEEVASLEPSISAYHLAIDAQDRIYVTGPTFAARDCLYRIAMNGNVETLLRGLARPQGMAFLPEGDLLIAAGYKGRKGIFRYSPADGSFRHYIAAPIPVGLAVADRTAYLATGDALYSVPLPGSTVN